MSNFREFMKSKVLWHPTTWLLAVGAGIYGGVDMYKIREAKRAAGAPLEWPTLWMEQTFDVAIGALLEIAVVFCAVWLIAGLADDLTPWRRQLLLVIVYCAFLAFRCLL